MEPIYRETGRLMPVSPDGEVLLLLDRDPAEPDGWRWGTIGGALDQGESLQEAAVRELREETGLVVDVASLVGPVHEDVHDFSYAGVAYRGHSTFFAVAMEREVEISFEGLEAMEVGNVVEARWWSPDAVRADGRLVAPSLPDVMAAAINAVRGSMSS